MPEDAEVLDYATSAPPPADPIPLRRRLAAEGVGTFLMVFFGCGSMAVDAAYGGAIGHVGIGLVWGIVVMALIYAMGDVSGAHYNPAVSFAFWLAGRFRGKDALWYSGVQVVAATVAACVLLVCFMGHWDLGQTNPSPPLALRERNELLASVDAGTPTPLFISAETTSGDIARAFGFEIILTFALVFVILCVAVGSKERGLMAGIAIGGTVGICALAAGPVCRASMNPARSIGPAIAALDFQYLWLYCLAPMIGAAIAVGAWTYIYRHPKPVATRDA